MLPRTRRGFIVRPPLIVLTIDLSLEFLMGRTLDNAMLNIGTKKIAAGMTLIVEVLMIEGLKELGAANMEDVLEQEPDAALGNGGLGRLAACYLDSLATLAIPSMGYGIRYDYGIFKQQIIDGYQTEFPDYWLTYDNPWEIPRHDVKVDVRFGGWVRQFTYVSLSLC
jgi:glycogen phosphorylase